MADVVYPKIIYSLDSQGRRFQRGRFHIDTDVYTIGNIEASGDASAIPADQYREILRFDVRSFKRAYLYAVTPAPLVTRPHLDIRLAAHLRDYDDINDISITALLPGTTQSVTRTSASTSDHAVLLNGLGDGGLIHGAKAIAIQAKSVSAIAADVEENTLPRFYLLADLEI